MLLQLSGKIGARSCGINAGRKLEGHTTTTQIRTILEQAEILTGQKPHATIVDLGYRGRTLEGVNILHCGRPQRITKR